MLKKIILAATAASASLVALPATASAGHDRYYDRYEERRDRDGYYDRRGYDRRDYRRGGYRHYGYRDDRRHYRGERCGSGTTGAIVGGAAGALVGREVGRGGRSRYGYRRGGNGTVGAIVGGAIGALVGREVGRSC